MTNGIRDRLAEVRRRAFTPVIARVDVRADALEGRLESRLDVVDAGLARLASRLDEIEAVLQVTGARAAALSERSLGITESSIRVERRIEEIERLLGASAADH